MEPHQLALISMFNRLISYFKRGDDSLGKFELAIMNQVQSMLPSELADKLKNRLKSVNLVQRFDNDQEVNCFEMINGKAQLRDEHKLITNNGETVLASFSITLHGNSIITGVIWLIDGVFFSIEFSEPPTLVSNPEGIKIDVSIAEWVSN